MSCSVSVCLLAGGVVVVLVGVIVVVFIAVACVYTGCCHWRSCALTFGNFGFRFLFFFFIYSIFLFLFVRDVWSRPAHILYSLLNSSSIMCIQIIRATSRNMCVFDMRCAYSLSLCRAVCNVHTCIGPRSGRVRLHRSLLLVVVFFSFCLRLSSSLSSVSVSLLRFCFVFDSLSLLSMILWSSYAHSRLHRQHTIHAIVRIQTHGQCDFTRANKMHIPHCRWICVLCVLYGVRHTYIYICILYTYKCIAQMAKIVSHSMKRSHLIPFCSWSVWLL